MHYYCFPGRRYFWLSPPPAPAAAAAPLKTAISRTYFSSSAATWSWERRLEELVNNRDAVVDNHTVQHQQKTLAWLRARQVLVTASQAACFLRKSKETLSPYLQLYFNNGHSIDTEHDIVDTEVSPFTKILETSAKRLAKLNKSTTKISFGNHQNVDHPYDQEDFISNMNQRLLFNSNLLSVTQNPDTIKFIDAAYGLHPFTTASECLKSKTAIIKSTTTTTTSSSTPVIHSKQSNFTWGTDFESIAMDYYQRKYKVGKIHHLGLIKHQKHQWLGASVDGVNGDCGEIIEIKCPTRNLNFSGFPQRPDFYTWVQVQIQMEVLDLDSARIVQAYFVQYADLDDFLNDTNSPLYKGIYLRNTLTGDPIYPPPDLACVSSFERSDAFIQAQKLIDWCYDEIEDAGVLGGGDGGRRSQNSSTDLDYSGVFASTNTNTPTTTTTTTTNSETIQLLGSSIYTPIPWYLNKMFSFRVKRDREWFRAILPNLKLFGKLISA